MTSLTTLLPAARRAWNRALTLALLGRHLGLALALAGAAVLVGRVLGVDVAREAAASAGLAALVWTLARVRQRAVSDEQMATLLDLRLGGRGAVLHARDHGVDLPVSASLQDLTAPRADGRRVLRSLGPGAAFLGMTLFVPLRVPAPAHHEQLAEQRLEELAELATQLEEVVELDEELLDEVHENLASAEQGLDEQELTGEALQEALDQIEQRLDDAARQASDALQAARQELARAEAGADAGLAGAELEQTLEDLAAELADLGALPEGLDPADLSGLDASALAELARDLDAAALSKLSQLARAGLLDPSQLGQPGKAGKLSELPPLAKDFQPGGT